MKRQKKNKREKTPDPLEDVEYGFHEKNLKDYLDKKIEHPKPMPGYKATLPGAPGAWAKEDPGP